jgi:hypothetical protein
VNDKIEGRIAAILDKTTVVINRGTDEGVQRGTEFYIYSKLGPFRDPDTGEDLGATTQIWGKVEATIVEKKFCVARTGYHVSLAMQIPSLLDIFRTSRVELPVDGSDITSQMEKVRVGFSVVSVPKVESISEEKVPALQDGSACPSSQDEVEQEPRPPEGEICELPKANSI